MDIDPARAPVATPLADMRDRQSPPSTNEIGAFTQALFGPTHQLPEDVGTTRLQATASNIDAALRKAHDLSAVAQGPIEMLKAQSTLLRSMIEVDMIAKTAGAVSQGINKLTNMQ
jgi:type III secretion system YscI/HrpB-like protein